jgi:hypothetical protein
VQIGARGVATVTMVRADKHNALDHGLPLKSWRLFYAASGWSAASLSYWIGDINAAELCLRRVL